MPAIGSRRIVQPHSPIEDARTVARKQGAQMEVKFDGGMQYDPPVTPANALKHVWNYLVHPDRLVTRAGTREAITAALPAILSDTAGVVYTGYTATKTSDHITKTAGQNFTSDLVGDYFVHDDGTHDRIIAVDSTTTIQVDNSDARAASTAGYLRGEVNGRTFDEKSGRLIVHIKTELYILDYWAATQTYTRAYCVGGAISLPNTKSRICVYREWAYIATTEGWFRLNLDATPYLYYWINDPVPTVRITDEHVAEQGAEDPSKPYGGRYLYTMVRLSGTGIRNRQSVGVRVEHETGSTALDENYLDYGTVYSERPPGAGESTFGRLTGGVLSSTYDTAAEWDALGDDCRFKITIDGAEYEVTVDMTGVASMQDVAARIQLALRDYWPHVTCVWDSDHFVIESPIEGGTISNTSTSAGGTNIGSAGIMSCEAGLGTVENIIYGQPRAIGTLTPAVHPVSGKRNHACTHFGVYGSLDVGKAGTDPLTGNGNNPELLVWIEDVELGRPFYASEDASSIITLDAGQEFRQADVGSVLSYANGVTSTIQYLCNVGGTRVYTATSRYAIGTAGTTTRQAAVIGGGENIVVSQSGTTLTIVSGTIAAFAAAHKGMPLVWGDGSYSWIVAVNTGAGTATALDSATRSSEAATLNPVGRTCSIQVSDRLLRARASQYQLRTRFHEAMPPCNVGEVAAGFVFGLQTNGDTVHYSQIPSDWEESACHYRPDYQTLRFTDATQDLLANEAEMVVICTNSTRAFPLTNFLERKVTAAGETVMIVPTQRIADGVVGAMAGNIARVGKASAVVISSSRQLMLWNGTAYTQCLSEGMFDLLLKKMRGRNVIHYDEQNGVVFWGSET